ncbi:MAG: hypothetical protein RLZZ162_800, partial [Verrucomicrobiota bacterium]
MIRRFLMGVAMGLSGLLSASGADG